MTTHKTKLELTWIGKENRPRLEPRILLEDPAKSYHAPRRVSDDDLFDNRLIKGDNLLALKALEQEFTGKIKCICVDPPYNTGSAFAHYDDGIEHSLWLCLMRDRLEMFRSLLARDGSVWIFVDDSESHYLKVVCDEIFGRANFVANIIWQKKYAPANDAKWFSDSHDHILVYAKDKLIWQPNKLPRTDAQNKLYSNPDNDARGAWMSDNYTCAKSIEERPNLYYPITNPNTNEVIYPKKTRVWAFDNQTHQRHIRENLIYWGKIFNISKINSEVRGGKSPRIKKLSEVLGESYFAYLSGLEDLVLLMDESHRYRASAGARAINELKPVLGLELTATPYVETARGAVAFRNVIYDYPLNRAMTDGYVKEPAVVTRKDFNPAGMSPDAIEDMKLRDGVGLHESVKVELQTHARESGRDVVKPFVLVIARDTTHAGQLLTQIKSDDFFEGRYRDKVLQVDSSRTGAEEDEMVERLLKVEDTTEPTEIVIHVNMLKEGWDVTNLYTIIPLRAANARILIEQSIGRGLRLPYGRRAGVTSVDRLNIIAHDKFQEIVDEASRPGSLIQLKQVILAPEQYEARTVTVMAQSQLASRLGIAPAQSTAQTLQAGADTPPAFALPEEQAVAQIAYAEIQRRERLPGVTSLRLPDVQTAILNEVTSRYRPSQLVLEGTAPAPDLAAIVAKTTELVIEQTIDIPRILVVPTGEVRSGYRAFTLDVMALNHQPPSEELWIQMLRTKQREILGVSRAGANEARLEDYIVAGLVGFDDISYDDHAELLYDLAEQTVQRYRAYLTVKETRRVLQYYQRSIANFIHAQMRQHYWEESAGSEVKVSRGFTALKSSAYTASAVDTVLDYRISPGDKSNMARYLFGGFARCLYPVQKFQSEAERRLAVILERESSRWFKPAKGQFQMFYKAGIDQPEYIPDFVAECADCVYMLEPKARNEMDAPVVIAKRDVAVLWCERAGEHALENGGKAWKYLLIPHDAITDNMTIAGLAVQFTVS